MSVCVCVPVCTYVLQYDASSNMYVLCVCKYIYRYVRNVIYLYMHVNVSAYCCLERNARDSEHFDMDCNQAPFTAYKRARPALQLTV